MRRRSVRKFKSKQVPAHLVRRILEIGRYAPSQGNCQPWKFAVVRDKDMIARLEKYCVETIALGYPIVDPTQNYVPRQTHEIAWWEDGKKPDDGARGCLLLAWGNP